MLLHALKKSYEADVAEHSAVIDIYLQKPVGIGDHDKLLEVVKDRFNKLTCAKHSLDAPEVIPTLMSPSGRKFSFKTSSDSKGLWKIELSSTEILSEISI